MRNGKKNINGQLAMRSEPKLAQDVIMKLIEGNKGRRYCIVKDNFYFSRMGLSEELEKIETYATRSIRCK